MKMHGVLHFLCGQAGSLTAGIPSCQTVTIAKFCSSLKIQYLLGGTVFLL